MSWVSLTIRSIFYSTIMGRTSTPGQMPPLRPLKRKNTNWEGFRVPAMVAGRADPTSCILNDMMSHEVGCH